MHHLVWKHPDEDEHESEDSCGYQEHEELLEERGH